MFIGRQLELELLEEYYNSERSEFCVLYGGGESVNRLY